MTDGEDLKTFLETVLKPESETTTDQAMRNLGRGVGLYFLGAIDAGVEEDQALELAASFQVAILNVNRGANQ